MYLVCGCNYVKLRGYQFKISLSRYDYFKLCTFADNFINEFEISMNFCLGDVNTACRFTYADDIILP